jgi:predicted house-cleaning noncanonical NTP pyrophosphatase (MazG superfamily)
MKRTVYNKLVRDRIPEIIEAEGKKPIYETAAEEEYIKLLNDKFLEEVNEFIKSGTIEELADVGEVMHAILEYKGISLEQFQKARMEKLEERGKFNKRIFLKEVIED